MANFGKSVYSQRIRLPLRGWHHLFSGVDEKVLPPLVDFAILGTTKSTEFCSLGSGLDCSVIED